jgi:hypothetical protein
MLQALATAAAGVFAGASSYWRQCVLGAAAAEAAAAAQGGTCCGNSSLRMACCGVRLIRSSSWGTLLGLPALLVTAGS